MTSALANREPVVALVRGLAQEVATLEPVQYGEAHNFLAFLEDAVARLKGMVVARAEKEVMERGETITDKGTKALELGGWYVRAIPNRTGIDPKKFEARLRTKGVLPENYMQPKITYAMDPAKTAKAVADGVITEAELSACKYDLTYKLTVTQVASNPPQETPND